MKESKISFSDLEEKSENGLAITAMLMVVAVLGLILWCLFPKFFFILTVVLCLIFFFRYLFSKIYQRKLR
ncbi:hypothetical protein KKH36_02380 [Patescibacteria group bacterium]|nr:hypothetical protein [Patescibacteria group bacterium]